MSTTFCADRRYFQKVIAFTTRKPIDDHLCQADCVSVSLSRTVIDLAGFSMLYGGPDSHGGPPPFSGRSKVKPGLLGGGGVGKAAITPAGDCARDSAAPRAGRTSFRGAVKGHPRVRRHGGGALRAHRKSEGSLLTGRAWRRPSGRWFGQCSRCFSMWRRENGIEFNGLCRQFWDATVTIQMKEFVSICRCEVERFAGELFPRASFLTTTVVAHGQYLHGCV
jgi:hypothetical protein